jgi:hypothetical protein
MGKAFPYPQKSTPFWHAKPLFAWIFYDQRIFLPASEALRVYFFYCVVVVVVVVVVRIDVSQIKAF